MLYSGKNFALRATEKINILTLVLSENIFLNETKNHNPPLQIKWSVPNEDKKFKMPHIYFVNDILFFRIKRKLFEMGCEIIICTNTCILLI